VANLAHSPGRDARLDLLHVALLFGGTVAYLSLLPHDLNAADEANYLYDAKRVLNGAVTYRDYFTVITPGFMYLMAALFWLFGTTIDTARISTAVLHGLIVVLLYLTCRRLGVRRELSWPPALAHLAVAQPAWPIASQHWLSTLVCALLLFVCAGRVRSRSTWPLFPGIVLGLLIAVQQQRGLFMAGGVFLWLVADAFLQRRYRAVSTPALAAQLAWLIAGIALIMIPLGIYMIASAGFDSVWQSLVIFPLFNYRSVTRCEWGHINIMTAWQGSFTFPRLLKYLPVILAVAAPRLFALWLLRRRPEEVARLTLLLVFCLASMASIAYFPDFIHIAFIAPAFFVAIAESLEWAARQVPGPVRLTRAAGWAAGVALLAGCVMHLQQNRARLQSEFRISRMTAFGRIDFRTAAEAATYDRLQALLQQTPSRYLYVYPGVSHLYLLLDVDNPTPWGFYVASFHGAERLRNTIQQLATKQPAYVVILSPFVAPDDELVAWIRRHYEPISDGGSPLELILRRKTGTDG
jgi:hypothetical protein